MHKNFFYLSGLFAGGWMWDQLRSIDGMDAFGSTTMPKCIPEMFNANLAASRKYLAKTISERRIPDVVLLANSMGGLVALDFARHYPDLVSGLIISGVPGLDEVDVGVSLDDLATGEPEYAMRLGKKVYRDHSKIPERGVKEVCRVFSDDDLRRKIAKWLIRSRTFQPSIHFDDIECNVDLIWGSHDQITPGSKWRSLSANYDNVLYREVHNSGHSPMVERPVDFANLMLSGRVLSDGNYIHMASDSLRGISLV